MGVISSTTALVGFNIRRLRKRAGMTLADAAAVASMASDPDAAASWVGRGAEQVTAGERRTGSWSPSAWGNLEGGAREITADVLVLAAYVVSYGPPGGQPPTEPVTVADLFTPPRVSDMDMPLDALRGVPLYMLSGRLPMGSVPLTTDMVGALMSGTPAQQVWPASDEVARPDVSDALTAAEGRRLDAATADKLDQPAWLMDAIAHAVYGRSLLDERTARAGEGTSKQARGHATRAMVAQLRAWIADHPDQVDALRDTLDHPDPVPAPVDPRPRDASTDEG